MGCYTFVMAADIESLLEQVLKLTPEQRMAVIDAIWQSLDNTPPIEPTEAEKAEIQRRWAEYEKDPSRAHSREEFDRRMEAAIERGSRRTGSGDAA